MTRTTTMTTMRTWGLALLVALTLAPASELSGQCGRRGPCTGAEGRGAPALSLELSPGQGAFLGLWGPLAGFAALGVETELSWRQVEEEREPTPGAPEEETETTTTTQGIGVSARLFLSPRATVTPFVYGHVGVGRSETEVESRFGTVEDETTHLLVRGALGVEWFASPRFSAGANLGARWRAEEEDGAGDVERETLDLLTTGLSLTFYF
jgi:hypothetical protein